MGDCGQTKALRRIQYPILFGFRGADRKGSQVLFKMIFVAISNLNSFLFFSFDRPTIPPTLPLADEYFGSEAESGKPDGQFPCPKEYAALIQDCWQATPQGRPSFLVSCNPPPPFEFRFSWALTLTNQCGFQTIIRRLHQQLSLRAWN